MAEQPYDPAKRKERYERTKQLKGRSKGASKASANSSHSSKPLTGAHKKVQASQGRVIRVRKKLKTLNAELAKTQAELSERRQSARREKKKDSDGKSTQKEKRASQEQRDKHQAESKSSTKKTRKSSGGGGGSKSSSGVADMSTRDLEARVIKIRGAIRVARRLLSDASLEHGQLAHSAIVSEPDVNERFARFQSAERGPST